MQCTSRQVVCGAPPDKTVLLYVLSSDNQLVDKARQFGVAGQCSHTRTHTSLKNVQPRMQSVKLTKLSVQATANQNAQFTSHKVQYTFLYKSNIQVDALLN